MSSSDQYRSIAAPAQGLFKDKSSRFIAFALPVTGEEEIRQALEKARREYHDARHICFAYRYKEVTNAPTPAQPFGEDAPSPECGPGARLSDKWRINDDGEPSGTAGRPILGQIDSLGLSDVLVYVVRYFGGIKLGVPGLINAYRSAAADALSNAGVCTKTACERIEAEFPYESLSEVMKLTKGGEIRVEDLQVDTRCRIVLSVPLSLTDEVRRFPAFADVRP